MYKRIKRLFEKPPKLEKITISQPKSASFLVLFEKTPIGNLEFENGIWQFSYTDEFRKAPAIAPLFEFPDPNKIYVSPHLFPYFSGRIPGLKQPEIQKVMAREKIEKTDLAALLARFGRQTITDPFILVAGN